MFCYILTEYNDVIKVDNQGLQQVFPEDLLHQSLEGGWCVGQAKWHSVVLEETKGRGKGSLVTICRVNLNLVVC